ncbi:MAG: RsmB/NOP family class I SAM-dependent RNA methyltransferase [Thermosulfidibacteraceae bacterium]|jgi:16S rRNA (cytosine967-C5)-methyltransferase
MVGEIHPRKKQGFKIFSNGLELAVKILEILEKNKDMILAREQVFKGGNYYQKSKEIATIITNEVGRRLGVIDRIIEEAQGEELKKSSSLLRSALRVGSYLVYFDRKEPAGILAAMKPFLEKKGGIGLIKRLSYVLRKVSKYKPKVKADIEAVCFWYYFFPEWITRKMIESFGEEKTIKIMEEMNKTPYMSVRVNTRKISKEDLARILGERYQYELEIVKDMPFLKLEKNYPVMKIEEYEKGFFTVQDFVTAAGIKKMIYKLPEGATVLDCCSAPGRKLSYLMQERNDLKVFAMDISLERLKRMIRDFKRLGIELPYIIKGTATKVPLKIEFDFVHLDVPCSGSGTWGKHPERRWLTEEDHFKECIIIQREILKEASRLTKKDGYILYSTCSLWKEENEDNISWFLSENRDFELIEEERSYPVRASTGFYHAILRKT